jgi:hypothetical protein
VGLRDVTVLGVDERFRQPLEVCVDPQHPGFIALSRSQKVPVPLFRRRHIEVGHAPEVPLRMLAPASTARFPQGLTVHGERRRVLAGLALGPQVERSTPPEARGSR